MKQFYTTVILVFSLQFCYGQIEFEENVVFDGRSDNYYSEGPQSAYSVDIDGDGDNDIVSGGGAWITWLENLDGLGTFGEAQLVSSSSANAISPQSVYAIDIDNDGDIDVLSASSGDDKIAWYENIDGQGTFGNQQVITINADGASSVFASDLDGDGDIDVISASIFDDKIAWYENMDGQGSFGPQNVISTNTDEAMSVYSSDIDGDGDMDILSASRNDNKIAWYENIDGLATFGTQQIITSNAEGALAVRSSDVDGDGDLDVFSASLDDNKIAWYENMDGQGAFGIQQIISTNADQVRDVSVSDIDGDGDMDVISTDSGDNTISWYENIDGLGSFSAQQIISKIVKQASSVLASDLDNDGDLDVISASYLDSKIAWYENIDSQGSFGIQNILTPRVTANDVFSIDVDNDGDLDIVTSSGNDGRISWFENTDGQGGFKTQHDITVSASFSLLSRFDFVTDLNNDGYVDFVSVSDNTKLIWYINVNGSGIFTEQIINELTVALPGYGYTSVDVSDLDNDGDLDLICAISGTARVVWYENIDGQGTFGGEQIISMENSSWDLFLEDLDLDGDKDIVMSINGINDRIVWYENMDGQGAFGSEVIITTEVDNCRSVFVEDLDGDGDMDILSASINDNKIAWYENIDGQGAFGNQQIISTIADRAKSVIAADLDQDGDTDVISTSVFDHKLAWYENVDGQGSFGVQQIVSTSNLFPDAVFAADFNNDGKLDLVTTSSNLEGKLVWYKNLSVASNEISGIVRLDIDMDGCSVSDEPISNVLMITDNGSDSFATFSLDNGIYQLFTNEGIFSTEISSQLPNYYVSNPTSQISNFTGVGNTDNVDFCIEPITIINDLNISIYPTIDEPRPGFNTTYQIVYNNMGTTQLSGSVAYEFDDSKLNFLSASEAITSQTTNTLNFDFTDLNPFETRTIDLEFNVFAPPTTNIDDELVATATINPVSGDETEEDNVFTLEQTVIGSYDPNDITVLEGDQIFIDEANKYLHYLIRFQNTGTASAINVRVDHVLDSKLDWTTMQLESLSHTGRVEITNETDVSFIFNNINLADSTNDEPNSHGFIAYKIKPKNDVEVGDIISGTADIFFDFNPAIITNTVSTEIVESLSVDQFNAQAIQVFPNPVKNQLEITSGQIIDHLTIVDINGRILKEIKLSNLEYSLDVSSLAKGVYFMEIYSGNSSSTKKFIKN
ncbi:putative secreted protein (Por secretion system target) [Winogradskyella eximia]|uniref:Putative secreted protein (Por secretion system target) n=1 Tax=Winogradskyella eximia TaxID=262006 RepID=A0A3D9H7P0_9FLAO|nr:T9SS type A sorting domain-containing protein [Winogradskyella eximia]RED45517.1 putative secreted protein (Por secretion system target) [Winogradskyella eximia]